MKKIVLFVLLVGMLCFTACGNGETSDNKEGVEKQEQREEDTSESQKDESKKDVEEQEPLVGELVMDFPEGFTPSETESGLIVYQNETDLSNIVLKQIEGEGDLTQFDGDELIEALEASLIEAGEEEPNVSFVDEKWYEIDGHEAYKIVYSYYIFGEERMVDSLVIVNGDKFECITFTNKVVEGYEDIFAEVEESIHFE